MSANSCSALHVLVGAKLLNTLSNSAECTVIYSVSCPGLSALNHSEIDPPQVITALMCFFISLPRTLSELSGMGIFSAVTMGIAVLLAMIFAGIQDHPFGYIPGQEPIVTLFPVKGTTFVVGVCVHDIDPEARG
jgi:hypothetical protein